MSLYIRVYLQESTSSAARVCRVGLCSSLPNEHGLALQFFALNRVVLQLSLIIACEVEHMVLKGF